MTPVSGGDTRLPVDSPAPRAGLLDDPRRARWLVLLALLLGLVVRLVVSQDAEFGSDMGLAYPVARGIATGEHFPLIGAEASWGGRSPFPGYYYLAAPGLLLGDRPCLWMAWGALLCWLGLLPFVRLLWERYGPRVAVFGAVLVATSPWHVFYSESPWSPNLSVPAAACILYVLHRVLAAPRSRWIALLPAAYLLQAHLYPNLPVTVGAGGLMLLVARPAIAWRWLLLGTGLAGLTVVPSLVHLLLQGSGELVQVGNELPYHLGKDLLNSAYSAFLYGTSEISYWMAKGYWFRWDTLSWLQGLPRTLDVSYGPLLDLVVVLGLLVSVLAWARGATQGIRALIRRPLRELDPLAVGLVGGALASVLMGPLLHKPFLVRYNIVLIWFSFVPLLLLYARSGRLGQRLLGLYLLVLVPGNLALVHHFYDRIAHPNSVRTISDVVGIVHAEQGARPFELSYPTRRLTLAVRRLGTGIHGAGWQMVGKAPVRYAVLPRPERMKPHHRALYATPGARIWDIYQAVLVRVPGALASLPAGPHAKPAVGATRVGAARR